MFKNSCCNKEERNEKRKKRKKRKTRKKMSRDRSGKCNFPVSNYGLRRAEMGVYTVI